MKHLSSSFRALAVLGLALGLTGCPNVFSPIDNPSGDAQLLSAARAAFDKGDIGRARELYGKLGANETATSELIFVDMDGCGADIGAFGSALANGIDNAGLIITIMAEKMASLHSATCMETLHQAYIKSQTLTNSDLKGFTGFLAAVSIAGEALANSTNIQDGTLTKADFVVSANCNATTHLCTAACAVSDGITNAAAVDISQAGTLTATWGTVQGAFAAATTNLGTLGVVSGPSLTLVNNPLLSAQANNNNNYRCVLDYLGVGR